MIGYGRVGSELAQVLRDRGVPMVIIDDNADHVIRAHAAGIPAVGSNAAADKVLAEAHPDKAKDRCFGDPRIPQFEGGLGLTKLRAINPSLTLLARARSDAEVKHLLGHGADARPGRTRGWPNSLAEMGLSTPALPPAAAGRRERERGNRNEKRVKALAGRGRSSASDAGRYYHSFLAPPVSLLATHPKRLGEVGAQVVDMLDADRQPHDVLADAGMLQLFRRPLSMRR